MRFKFCSLFILTALAMAQQPQSGSLFNQAPPDVHKALIANVTAFYQNFVDAKFRNCIPLVAEESQDDFFNIQKDKFRNFEIIKVDYKDDSQRAVVTITVGITHMFRGIGYPLAAPIASNWKLEKGEWRWFIDKTFSQPTAFGGAMKPGVGSREEKLATRPESAATVLAQVKVDSQEMMLSSFAESKGEILITNDMPGAINLKLEWEDLPGLKLTLDKKELQAGEKAKLLFAYKPVNKSPKPMRRALLSVEQTGAQIPITIQFAVPQDPKKSLPTGKK